MKRYTAHDADVTEAEDGEYVRYADMEDVYAWVGFQVFEISKLRQQVGLLMGGLREAAAGECVYWKMTHSDCNAIGVAPCGSCKAAAVLRAVGDDAP